mgnify:CR=1 FL=1
MSVKLEKFRGMRVLVTGGLGFLGSNLAYRLVGLGAEVTLVDAMIPGYGGNLFNIAPVRDQVTVNFSDVRDAHVMNYLVQGQDYIFHLAGQVDHVLSITDPYPDIDINVRGTTVLLEALKHHNRAAKLVYVGTRGQYGKAVRLPVDENAPTNPRGVYEITRLAAEKIVQVYHDVHGIESVMLRLSNIYGERGQMRHPRYGVVNWFVRIALEDGVIQVFGDGKIKRDFLYVSDCIDALLLTAAAENAYGEILNVGVDQPTDFIELAETLIDVAQSGSWQFAPFTAERKAQEPGDFYSDITKIRTLVGWTPVVTLRDGLSKTVEYYRQYSAQYW